jgi:hypothetical protein
MSWAKALMFALIVAWAVLVSLIAWWRYRDARKTLRPSIALVALIFRTDRIKTVSKPDLFEPWGLPLSEEQTPHIVEKPENRRDAVEPKDAIRLPYKQEVRGSSPRPPTITAVLNQRSLLVGQFQHVGVLNLRAGSSFNLATRGAGASFVAVALPE